MANHHRPLLVLNEQKNLNSFFTEKYTVVTVHSFVIPDKERYGLQIYSWFLMVYVQFWLPLPHELLWSVTLVNSTALFLQRLYVSGKHSTGLFVEAWLVLILFCHLDFCLGSHEVHLSHRAKDFSCFCICTYMCSHMWMDTGLFICVCMRSHCCELLVQTSTTKLKFCYAQFISSLHISFHWLESQCMWQKDQKPLEGPLYCYRWYNPGIRNSFSPEPKAWQGKLFNSYI